MDAVYGGLSVYEHYTQNGLVLVALDGELNNTLSSGILSGTSYYLPGNSQDFVRAQDWGEKSFLIQADQPLSVDVLETESPSMVASPSAGTSFNTVKGMSIPPSQFVPNNWNVVDTTDNLNLVQLRVTTQGSAPTKIQLVVRFRKM